MALTEALHSTALEHCMTRFGILLKLCLLGQNLVFATACLQAAKLPVCQSMVYRPETMYPFPQLDQEQKTD